MVDYTVERFGRAANKLNGHIEYVKVKEDNGCEANWIHRDWVDKLNLPVRDLPSAREFMGIDGRIFEARQEVELSLTGQRRKSMHADFLIAPERFPVDGVSVGTEFINEFGCVHVLFSGRKTEEALLAVQNKIPVGKEPYRMQCG
jgi:hypothetical protein